MNVILPPLLPVGVEMGVFSASAWGIPKMPRVKDDRIERARTSMLTEGLEGGSGEAQMLLKCRTMRYWVSNLLCFADRRLPCGASRCAYMWSLAWHVERIATVRRC